MRAVNLRGFVLFIVVAAVCGGMAAAVFISGTHRRSKASRSVHPRPLSLGNPSLPTASYVGAERCAECHSSESQRFATSGHARTFRHTRSADFAFLDGRRYRDRDYQMTFHYSQGADGLSATLPEIFPDREFPLSYALGSGTHAVTFLSLVDGPRGEAVGVEHRISVYEGEKLSATPGASAAPPVHPAEYFGRLVQGAKLQDCIACHTTQFEIDGLAVRNLQPHVQCERCHGPGSEHVQAWESGRGHGELRFSPGLATATEEIQMCGECHRLPDMLAETPLDRMNATLARYQPVGLIQSACFQNANEALRCTTCHDPHQRANLTPQHEYNNTCRECHRAFEVATCSYSPAEPVTSAAPDHTESAENCIQCHMPAVEALPGVTFHDHWIRIRDADDPAAASVP